MRAFVWAAVLAGVAIGNGTRVDAGPITSGLGQAADYNVFAFGNANLTSSDIEGRAAIGGNATFSSYSVASKGSTSSGTPNLVVGGNLNFTNGSVKGAAVVGGAANLTSTTVDGNLAVNGNATLTNLSFTHTLDYGGTLTKSGVNTFVAHSGTLTTIPVDFAAAQTYLTAESAYLGSLSQTGTVESKWSGLWLTGTSTGNVQVFDINASALSGITYMNIAALAGQTVIVNVFGTSATFPNIGVSVSGTDTQHLLYNFVNATSLSISSLNGSVLAPLAAVTFSPGALNGTLIAKSVTGGGESHNVPFQGTLPTLQADPAVQVATPEPSSLLLFGAGLGSLLVTRARRGRRDA